MKRELVLQFHSQDKLSKWMNHLEKLYEDNDLRDAFNEERQDLPIILSLLNHRLKPQYKMQEPFAIGGTSIVFKMQNKFSKNRVLKFSRPRAEFTSEAVMKEGLNLFKLSHPNIVDVEDVASIKYAKDKYVGFTVTHYIDGEDWKQHIIKIMKKDPRCLNQVLERLLRTLYDVVRGLEYIHSKDYIHMDIKPSNVLVSSSFLAHIADLGSAKNRKINPDANTTVGFTRRYAHPELLKSKIRVTSENRVKVELKHKQFERKYDIYSLGQSLLEILSLIHGMYPDKAKVMPRFRYIHLMASRMLDGTNSNSAHFFNELPEGLSDTVLKEVKYVDCGQIREDIEKELGIWLPEREIPELNLRSRETIQSSDWLSTTKTKRLEEIIQHPLVSRLSRISQLGLARFVYPTASHTRFEHTLGTFTTTCAYIDTLYHDQNPLFRQLVSRHDIRALIVTSILHDLGQYPLAHDIEEVDSRFAHPSFTEEFLDHNMRDHKGKTLRQIVENKKGWSVSVTDIKKILNAKTPGKYPYPYRSSFATKLLSTIIDGPIDADKLDYLMRDNKECHLKYGYGIDLDRLMKTVTVEINEKDSPELAVYSKGRPSAESLAFTRYLMFASVYWHHTSRAYKTMIQYAFKLILDREGSNGKFIEDFKHFVVNLSSDDVQGTSLIGKLSKIGSIPNMSEGDLAVLNWLYQKAPASAKQLILCLARRKLYKRLASIYYTGTEKLTGTGPWNKFQRISSDWSKKLEISMKIQTRLLNEVMERTSEYTLDRQNKQPFTKFKKLMQSRKLMILLDVPPVNKIDMPLRYVKETFEKEYSDDPPMQALSDLSQLWQGPIRDLFNSIAIVRIFCHADVLPQIKAAKLRTDEIIDLALEQLSN